MKKNKFKSNKMYLNKVKLFKFLIGWLSFSCLYIKWEEYKNLFLRADLNKS